MRAALTALCLLLALPVLGVLGAWLAADAAAWQVLVHQAQTVLPDYALQSALLAGGVVAAPVAAWLVRFLHPRLLGAAIGGLIVLTNARTLLSTLGIEGEAGVAAFVALATFWVIALVAAGRAVLAERQARLALELAAPAQMRTGFGTAD